MKQKTRKPREWNMSKNACYDMAKISADLVYLDINTHISMPNAKRLHAWLGQALKYLSQQNKKET